MRLLGIEIHPLSRADRPTARRDARRLHRAEPLQSSAPNKRLLGMVGDVGDEAGGAGAFADGAAAEFAEGARRRARGAERGDAGVGDVALLDGAGADCDVEGGAADAPASPTVDGSAPRAGGSPVGARSR